MVSEDIVFLFSLQDSKIQDVYAFFTRQQNKHGENLWGRNELGQIIGIGMINMEAASLGFKVHLDFDRLVEMWHVGIMDRWKTNFLNYLQVPIQ